MSTTGGEPLSRGTNLGILLFVGLCGIPALEMNGFGFGLPITLPVALGLATLGGALGGAFMCPRPLLAGLVGGLLAGPLGLLAVYFYTQGRHQVTNVELVLVQGVACLPGVGIGLALKYLLKPAT
ncbi:MAG: hypothetical protein AB7K24_13045 [Gemmataceae bacterium]